MTAIYVNYIAKHYSMGDVDDIVDVHMNDDIDLEKLKYTERQWGPLRLVSKWQKVFYTQARS